MKSIIAIAIAIGLAGTLTAVGGCGGTKRDASAAAFTPSWTRSVMGGDCDLAGAVDYEAFDARPDKDSDAAAILHNGRSLLSGISPLPVPRGKRVAACVRMVPDKGQVASWLVIVTGVPPKVSELLATGETERLSNGATAVGKKSDGAGRLFIFNSTTIVVASQSIEARLGTVSASDVPNSIDLPKGTILRAVVGGEAAKRLSREWRGSSSHDGAISGLVSGLEEASFEIRVEDEHLQAIAYARYQASTDAERVETAIRAFWSLLGQPSSDDKSQSSDDDRSDRTRKVLTLMRAVTRLDVRRDAGAVEAKLTLLHLAEIKDRKPEPPPTRMPSVSPSAYSARCPKGQRLDLDGRTCVDNP